METIIRKSLLYKSGVEYADYCINHVLGCSHGCKYPCYAFLMKHRFGQVKDYKSWCRPKLVANSIDLLKAEIPIYRDRIKYVHLSFSTDPFMFMKPEVAKLSIEIIQLLNDNQIPCTTLTKGVYPINKFGKINTNTNEFGISLVTLKEDFRKRFEPNAALIKDRIKSLFKLSKMGYKTWVSIEPYPTPNLIKQDLNEILDSISFVDKIVFGRMNYSKSVSEYSDYKNYYNSQANNVINFCRKNKIKYHIKEGTVSDF